MPILDRSTWPKEAVEHHAHVKAIFIGGCVQRGDGSRFRAKAHAHTAGAHKGTLCFLSERRLAEPMLVLHEIAHLISEAGHTDKWRKALLAIGGTLDPVAGISKSYHKRPRGARR